MAQIQKLPISRLTVTEILSYGQSLVSQIDSSNISKNDFKPHYDSFKSNLEILDDCNYRIVYTSITSKLKQLGVKRRSVRSSISSIILSYTKFKDEATKQSAEKLKELNRIFKDIFKKSFFQQSAIISDFIKTATSETYKADVEKLHLTEWIAYLNELNNEYSHLRNTRIEKKGINNSIIKTSEAKKLFIDAHDVLRNRLNSLANVNGEDSYIELFAFWNALIDELRISISMRKGIGQGGKPSSTTNNQPNPSSGPVNSSEDDRPVIE